MSDARSRILARVRAAQSTGSVPMVSTVALEEDAVVDGRAAHDLLARFLAELTALGVEHHVEPTAEAVRARIAAVVGDAAVLRWDAAHLPYGVGDLFARAADGSSPRAEQAAAAVGITGCDAAIAETGSLALVSGPGKARAASLLPPTHVAVVRSDQLRLTMGEFFRERAADLAAAANCTFVTGPSRTADIELTLTVGVHGPGRVVVIVGP